MVSVNTSSVLGALTSEREVLSEDSAGRGMVSLLDGNGSELDSEIFNVVFPVSATVMEHWSTSIKKIMHFFKEVDVIEYRIV